MVATDAVCYMNWVAAQYGLELEQQYQTKDSCFASSGDKTDINKDVCWFRTNFEPFLLLHHSFIGHKEEPDVTLLKWIMVES